MKSNYYISPEDKNIMDVGLAIIWDLIIVGTLAWMFLLCVHVLPEAREARRSANARVENVESNNPENSESVELGKTTGSQRVPS